MRFCASPQVIIASSYPARPVIRVRMVQCVWRSWIRTISLWVSAVTVAVDSLAPAVKSMWMSAVPAPVFTASAMMVRNSLCCQPTYQQALEMKAILQYMHTHTHILWLCHICFCSLVAWHVVFTEVNIAANKGFMRVDLFHLMWGSRTLPAGVGLISSLADPCKRKSIKHQCCVGIWIMDDKWQN